MTEAWLGASRGSLPQRLSAWEDFLQKRILGLQVYTDARTKFYSSARMSDFGALSVTRYEVAPQTMARTSRLTADGDFAQSISILESGRLVAINGRQSTVIQPGEAIMMAAETSSALIITEPSVFWGVKLLESSPVTAKPETRGGKTFLRSTDVSMLLTYCQLIDQLPRGSHCDEIAGKVTDHIYGFVNASLMASLPA